MEHSLIQNTVEHPIYGEHEEDNSMKVEVAFDGVHSPFRYRHKKRSKVWEEYKPIFLSGKVQYAECLYCHNRLSCKDSNGTSHLWRHQKICPGKEEAAQRREKNSYFPRGVEDLRAMTFLELEEEDVGGFRLVGQTAAKGGAAASCCE